MPNRRLVTLALVASVVGLGVWVLEGRAWRGTLLAARDLLFVRRVPSNRARSIYDSLGTAAMEGISFPVDSRASAARMLRVDPAVAADRSSDPLTELQSMLKLMPSRGGNGCGTIRALSRKLQVIEAGSAYGCCSDFVEAFLVVATAAGRPAREVENTTHAFAEVWFPALRKWVFIDPQHGLVARSPTGVLLGARELGGRLSARTEVKFDQIVDKGSATQVVKVVKENYNESSWRYLRITAGADVVAQDRVDSRMRFLPSPLAQLVEYAWGRRPHYLELSLSALGSGGSAEARR